MELGPQYIIFTNVIFYKSGYVKTAELDHLVVSPYGLFCIETKSHSGKIYGGVYTEQWTQYLAGRGYKFYNPLLQNDSHCRALQALLKGVQKSKVHNYVAFPFADTVKVSSNDVFTKGSELIRAISVHQAVIYSRQELTDIAYTIARYTSEYESMRVAHAENVLQYVSQK